LTALPDALARTWRPSAARGACGLRRRHGPGTARRAGAGGAAGEAGWPM